MASKRSAPLDEETLIEIPSKKELEKKRKNELQKITRQVSEQVGEPVPEHLLSESATKKEHVSHILQKTKMVKQKSVLERTDTQPEPEPEVLMTPAEAQVSASGPSTLSPLSEESAFAPSSSLLLSEESDVFMTPSHSLSIEDASLHSSLPQASAQSFLPLTSPQSTENPGFAVRPIYLPPPLYEGPRPPTILPPEAPANPPPVEISRTGKISYLPLNIPTASPPGGVPDYWGKPVDELNPSEIQKREKELEKYIKALKEKPMTQQMMDKFATRAKNGSELLEDMTKGLIRIKDRKGRDPQQDRKFQRQIAEIASIMNAQTEIMIQELVNQPFFQQLTPQKQQEYILDIYSELQNKFKIFKKGLERPNSITQAIVRYLRAKVLMSAAGVCNLAGGMSNKLYEMLKKASQKQLNTYVALGLDAAVQGVFIKIIEQLLIRGGQCIIGTEVTPEIMNSALQNITVTPEMVQTLFSGTTMGGKKKKKTRKNKKQTHKKRVHKKRVHKKRSHKKPNKAKKHTHKKK